MLLYCIYVAASALMNHITFLQRLRIYHFLFHFRSAADTIGKKPYKICTNREMTILFIIRQSYGTIYTCSLASFHHRFVAGAQLNKNIC